MTVNIVSSPHLLRAVATAVVRLSRVEVPGNPVYEPGVQRAYNHVVLACLLAKVEAPASVAHLVHLAATSPVSEWLPGCNEDSLLVDGSTNLPTQDCLELAVHAADAFGEQFENDQIGAALDACRLTGVSVTYERFRRLLIERPVMSWAELQEELGDLLLQPTHDVIRDCYGPAPAHLRRDGEFAVCDGCNCLLTPVRDGGWVCDLDRCRGRKSSRIARTIPADSPGGVYYLHYPLRVFVTGPGLPELDLERQLVKLGVQVTMWPKFDNYDLLIKLPDGRKLAVDVKDYTNPSILGQRFTGFKADPPYDAAYLVVPDFRFKRRSDYETAFYQARRTHRSGAPYVELWRLSRFVRLVESFIHEYPTASNKGE